MRIIVIGGGASGIVASIFAKRDNNEVIVLEKNNKCLKKLLITGNGKCNYFNDDFSFEHYYSDSNNLSFINDSNKRKVLDFFSSIGVVPRVKNGYYYPNSNQSYSVHNSLLKEASLRGVEIKNGVKVLNIVKKSNSFIVSTDNGDFICDKVIVSTGGKSYPKTGSEGDGYIFGKSLGHKIVPVVPSLVGLVSNDKFIKPLSGVRCDACVSLNSKSEIGEVQFTDYGLSGICIFNLSNIASRLGNCSVKINFLYNFVSDFDSFCKLFDSVNGSVLNRSIGELLEGYLNYNIVNVILKMSGIDFYCSWNDLGNKKRILFDNLVSFNVDIVGTRGFDVAQVSLGGISLDDIDVNTFESKIVPGLYFTGEVMDVTGDCGGYNLGFAFLSGMIAGESVGDL
jgi:predicted Rossmann fold flavoprotein